MKLRRIQYLFPICLIWICFNVSAQIKAPVDQSSINQVDEFLRNRIEAAGSTRVLTVGEEIIHASVLLPVFYERRIYQPAWSNSNSPLPQVAQLIQAIQEADREGLRPEDYHLAKIRDLIEGMEGDKKTPTPRSLVDLELLLTDAFLIYGSHLLSGRINPETIDSEWFANRREADLAEVLQRALNESRIKEALQNLLPPQQNYQLMKTALANYREIESQGKWPGIPDGFKMQKGDQSERVALLRQRLMISGDLDSPASSEPDQFNDDLEQAVRRFQQRHGLDVDGTVGKETVAALNIPVEGRIRQIILNLERWRWLPQELGYRHIIVNIANFELDVFEQNQLTMTMRVIVGRSYRRTPVFSDKMTYLVFNPFWHVPPGIAVRDILPLARKDSLYLSKQKIKVFKGWGGDAAEIDPKTIKWDSVSAKNFPYRFRQDPGPNNALGRVKFMFPNQFNVYLHDTPARELFQKTVRGFSSGCIRIEKPLELAEYVLRGDPKWGREQIIAASDKHLEQTVRLPEPIPVHLLYWTAWVGEDGIIHFRKDIYGRDKPLDEALREAPTGS